MILSKGLKSRAMCNCSTKEVTVIRNGKEYTYKDVDQIGTWRQIQPNKQGLCPLCGYYPLEVPNEAFRDRRDFKGIQASMGTRKRS